MDFLLVFHANLNYGLLGPDRYPQVCEQSYLALLEFFADRYAGAAWTLEMSGYTLDTLVGRYPESAAWLRRALGAGMEPAAGPYAHSILPNFPDAHARRALAFTQASWERAAGKRPRTGWVPECAWKASLPGVYHEAGLDVLIADYDSHLQTRTGVRVPRTYSHKPDMIDVHLRADPGDPDLHRALVLPTGGRAVMRTDRVAMRALKYLQGDLTWPEMEDVLDRYGQGEGCLAVYACDAEYVGTTAWYNLHERGPEHIFRPAPESYDRLARLVDALDARGGLITASQAADRYPSAAALTVADGMAWHHGSVAQWDTTPQSRELNRRCRAAGDALEACAARGELDAAALDAAWRRLVQAESSDGGYPLPPLAPGEYNTRTCREHVAAVEAMLARTRAAGPAAPPDGPVPAPTETP